MFDLKGFCGLFLLIFLTGCVDQSRDLASPYAIEEAVDSDFDRGTLMANLTDNIFIPNYKSTADRAVDFAEDSGVLAHYCGDSDNASKLDSAQVAWRELMDNVQQTEMHVIGPAQRNDSDLQKRIHFYTGGSLAACGLDQAVIQFDKNSDFTLTSRALNQRGMGAIEYLLFNNDLNHSCSSQVLTTVNWNDLPQSDRKTQRCNLALALAKDVAEVSQSIHTQWTAADAPYRTEFLNEASRGDNFQQITDALFYIETYTKSSKLAIPLGLDPDCKQITCVNLVESPYSQTSLRNVKVNAEEFLRIFNGGDGMGFDDLITDAGYSYITDRFKTQSAKVISQIPTIDTSLREQVLAISTTQDETACTNAMSNP